MQGFVFEDAEFITSVTIMRALRMSIRFEPAHRRKSGCAFPAPESLPSGVGPCVTRDDRVQCSDNAGSEFSLSPTSATVT